MNLRIVCCALYLALNVASQADALNREHVAPDAKWLVHLDCDNLRQTQVGDYLFNRMLVPKANEVLGDFKINVTNILQRISSLTAFGPDFAKTADATGVLLIHSDAETQKALEGLLVAQILANTNGPIKKLESETATLYSFGNQVFISPATNGPVIISKSRRQLETVRELLTGVGPSLATTKTFNEFPIISNNFLFLSVADALNLPNPIPAHAKVLQMADGGRVALGERDHRFCLDLALKGKTVEVTRQIQQVVEGMLALVTLGQPDYPDVTEIAQSTKVESNGDIISISVAYPADRAIARLDDIMTPKAPQERPPKQKAPKAKHKAKAKPVQPTPTPDAEEPAENSK